MRLFVDPRTTVLFTPLDFQALPLTAPEGGEPLTDAEVKTLEETNAKRKRSRIRFKLGIFTANEESQRQDDIRDVSEDGEVMVKSGSWVIITCYFGIRDIEYGEDYRPMPIDQLLKMDPEDIPENAVPEFSKDRRGYIDERILDWMPRHLRAEVADAIDQFNRVRSADLFD